MAKFPADTNQQLYAVRKGGLWPACEVALEGFFVPTFPASENSNIFNAERWDALLSNYAGFSSRCGDRMRTEPFDWSVGRDSILLAVTSGETYQVDGRLVTDVTGLAEIGLENPDGKLAGSLRSWFDKHADITGMQPYLCNLSVRPAHRGKGLGMNLCAACEYVAGALWGKDNIYLHVRASNAPAVSMYQKLGYRQILRIPDPAGEILYCSKALR
jgi:ribosomal protein S18 acetylase RimI-like enzyme